MAGANVAGRALVVPSIGAQRIELCPNALSQRVAVLLLPVFHIVTQARGRDVEILAVVAYPPRGFGQSLQQVNTRTGIVLKFLCDSVRVVQRFDVLRQRKRGRILRSAETPSTHDQ